MTGTDIAAQRHKLRIKTLVSQLADLVLDEGYTLGSEPTQTAPEASSTKTRKRKMCDQPNHRSDNLGHWHYEDSVCALTGCVELREAQMQPVSEAPKVRRMLGRGEPKGACCTPHEREHDECEGCWAHACQPKPAHEAPSPQAPRQWIVEELHDGFETVAALDSRITLTDEKDVVRVKVVRELSLGDPRPETRRIGRSQLEELLAIQDNQYRREIDSPMELREVKLLSLAAIARHLGHEVEEERTK